MNEQIKLTVADLIRQQMPSGWTPTVATELYAMLLDSATKHASIDRHSMYLTNAIYHNELVAYVRSKRRTATLSNVDKQHRETLHQLITRLIADGFTVTQVEHDTCADILIEWI